MDQRVANEVQVAAPSPAEIELARESYRKLKSQPLAGGPSVRIQLGDDDREEPVTIPTAALRLLMHSLSEVSKGRAVAVLPTDALLNSQQAADLLNVSKPYLLRLVDEGAIPSRKVGAFPCVRFVDLLAFNEKDDAARAEALDALAADAQELGMGC